ncbi:MAG: hypothetical protein ACM3ZC_15890 [Bacteroidota bacterium]
MLKRSTILAVLGVMLAGLGPIMTAAGEVKRYYSRDKSFSLELPGDWQVLEDITGAAFAALSPPSGPADGYRENVSVVYEDLPAGETLAGYFARTQAALRTAGGDLQEHGSGRLVIDGVSAQWFAFTRRIGNANAMVILYMLLNQGRVYVISCSAAPDEFLSFGPLFEKMALSFRVESARTPGQ